MVAIYHLRAFALPFLLTSQAREFAAHFTADFTADFITS
jgi:hypothetical protein